MRIFESILTLLSLGLLWHAVWFRKRPVSLFQWSFLIGLFTVSVIHFLMEGGRWQMGPVYLSGILVLIVYLNRTFRPSIEQKKSRTVPILLSILLLPFSLIAAGLPCLFPVFGFEKPTGPYQVGTVTYTWSDPERNMASGQPRRLNVQIWYPANTEPSAQKTSYIPDLPVYAKALEKEYGVPAEIFHYLDQVQTHTYQEPSFTADLKEVPLVILSHGNMMGARFTNSFQAIELASHGYVVAAVEHPQIAFMSPYPDGSYVPLKDFFSRLSMEYETQNKASIPIIEEQTHDIEFALEQLKKLSGGSLEDSLADKIDFSKIGLIGHSFGGATVVNALYKNPEFKAGINMDGVLYGNEREGSIGQPVLFMSANFFAGEKDKPQETVAKEQALWKQALGKEGDWLDIERAGHLSFTDFPLYSPLLVWTSPDVEQNHQIVKQASLCFLDKHLKGHSTSSLEAIPDKYPGVRFQKGN